jgi:hypothetical protein
MPARLSRLLLLMAVVGFAWGAAVTLATAGHYHVACVAHGFVHGDSTTDGSFFSRVEPGCGSTLRRCELYTYGSFIGSETASGTTTTCNLWSRSFGNYTECASKSHNYSAGVFASHAHLAHNYCA